MTASRALCTSVGLETLHSNVTLCNDKIASSSVFSFDRRKSSFKKKFVVCKNSFRSEALQTQTEGLRPRRHHHRLVK